MSSFFTRNLKRTYPTVSSGLGVWVTDSSGNRFLDACSGAIVANLGHGLQEINEAIAAQLSQIAFAHTSQFVSQAGLDLADRVIGMAPANFRQAGRAYFTAGGSESIETALKMARGYFVERGENTRATVISRMSSYHGSTAGALSATGHPARRKPYLPILRDQPHIGAVYPYRCRCGSQQSCSAPACTLALAGELEQAILREGPENVMAFIAEPVVGAALGASTPGPEYWPRIREICTKYGVLLIADEVMTGLGRVGSKFGCDLWNVQPDIICLGKGLSAGYLPLGAVLASGAVVAAFEQGSGVFEHGFTYSGHPVACAAGLASLAFLQEHNLIERVSNRQAQFFSALSELGRFDCVGDVRGRGFLAGVEFVRRKDSKEPFPADLRISQIICRAAAKNGLLVYPGSGSIDGVNGDHIMIAPPFTISDDELSELFRRLNLSIEAGIAEATAVR